MNIIRLKNSDIETIDDIVTQVKKKPEVTISFMKQWDREDHIRRDTREETKSEDGLGFIRFARSNGIPDAKIRSHLTLEMKLSNEIIEDLFVQADAKK